MFEHEKFDTYTFEEVTLNCDLYVMDERYIEEYERSFLKFFFDGEDFEPVGYVSIMAARSINDNSMELSWCVNYTDRFHQIAITLPKDQFVACVGCWQCDEKPHIFVRGSWLEHIHLRSHSIFALIDAIGVKVALENGSITRDKLVELRTAIDELSKKYSGISFISFADSILLKSNWTVGHFESTVSYNYNPEIFIFIAWEINKIYEDILGLNTYSVITQGNNEYYDDALLHISETNNHICLNSLGIPFAQLMDIEKSARIAIRKSTHIPSELYLDETYYHSLKFKYEFEKNNGPSNTYLTKMMRTPSKYFYSTIDNILSNLKSPESDA